MIRLFSLVLLISAGCFSGTSSDSKEKLTVLAVVEGEGEMTVVFSIGDALNERGIKPSVESDLVFVIKVGESDFKKASKILSEQMGALRERHPRVRIAKSIADLRAGKAW